MTRDEAKREAFRSFAAASKRCDLRASIACALTTFRSLIGLRPAAPSERDIRIAAESYDRLRPMGADSALSCAIDDVESAPTMPSLPLALEPSSIFE